MARRSGFGTAGEGLLRLETPASTFTHFLPAPEQPQDVTRNNVETLYQDDRGLLWLGGQLGLVLFDPGAEQFLRRYTKRDGIADNGVVGIIGDDHGQLWLSTPVRPLPLRSTHRNFSQLLRHRRLARRSVHLLCHCQSAGWSNICRRYQRPQCLLS